MHAIMHLCLCFAKPLDNCLYPCSIPFRRPNILRFLKCRTTYLTVVHQWLVCSIDWEGCIILVWYGFIHRFAPLMQGLISCMLVGWKRSDERNGGSRWIVLPNPIGMATCLARKFEFKFILAWTTEDGNLVPPYRGKPKHSGGKSS